VFWNLLQNAVKFTPRGGRVEMRIDERDARVRVDVSDTGQGIDPQFIPHVFDRFKQASSGGDYPRPGLGLGLAVVRELVQAHGGTVDVTSAGPGRGSVFTVILPVTDPDATPAQERGSSS
jgi:signal transduction histidine kinase